MTKLFSAICGAAMLLVAALFLLPGRAEAQTCPPGQRIIGMTPAGNGVARAPICGPDGSQQRPQQEEFPRFSRPANVLDSFGAFALSDSGGLSWSYYAPTSEAAEAGAVGACQKSGGKNCRSIHSFLNGCVALASGPDGVLFNGTSFDADIAQKKALERCNGGTDKRGKQCQLRTLAICSFKFTNASGAEVMDRVNALANNATPADLARASVQPR